MHADVVLHALGRKTIDTWPARLGLPDGSPTMLLGFRVALRDLVGTPGGGVPS
jgi:hypothetical protein